MSGAFDLGELTITWNRLWIVVFALAVFFALLLLLNAHAVRPADARRHAEPAHGLGHGHPHALGRCADLRARLRHCRHRRRGAQPDRQRLAQSRPGLHHRQLHGRGLRRRRQSLGHAGRRAVARHRSTSSSSPMPARCSARSWCWSSSSCSSRSGRAGCSRSREGRWKHDHRASSCARSTARSSSRLPSSWPLAVLVPALEPAACRRQPAACADLHRARCSANI